MIDEETIEFTIELDKSFWFASSFGKIKGGTDIFIVEEDTKKNEFKIHDM